MSTEPEGTSETPDERLARLLAEAEQARIEVEKMTGQDQSARTTLAPIPGTAGSGSGVAVPAEVSKRLMAETRAAAIKKQAEVMAIQEQMKAEMEARIREMNAILEPLVKQVKRMEEGIWTINLYLGRDEEIVRLGPTDADGTHIAGHPAPAETPLTLRQEVLSMDEETAAFAAEGGIDYTNLDVFDEWIIRPENLARVLPEPKGVVVLVPRRRGKDYTGDPLADAEKNAKNRWSYFLIRNGENLYRMKTDFVVGKHLIPGTTEFTGLFYKKNYDGTRTEILPGTREWEKAEEAQDTRQRHYMRMALILQGLVDRTPVFHPLPGSDADGHGGALNLLDDRTYTSGMAHLLLDAEKVLTDGRPDFYTWLKSKTSTMRVGVRVMGAFHTSTFKDVGNEGWDNHRYHANDRISPRVRDSSLSDKPEDGVLYRLKAKKTDRGLAGYVFKFERTNKRWIRNEWGREELRAPKTKGSCLVAPGDQFVIPFDLVTIEECRYYLGARSQRHAYEEMFPLLNAVIAAKEAEQAEEAPFRDLLARTLIQADADLAAETAADPTMAAAHVVLDPLIDWWKLKNAHHRALTGEPDHEAKAIREIVTEHLASKTGAATQEDAAEAAMVERLLGQDSSIMVVARTRDGGYLAFAPMPRAYAAGKFGYAARNRVQPPVLTDEERSELRHQHRDPGSMFSVVEPERTQIPAVVSDTFWVREYACGKTGRTIKTRDWVTPSNRLVTAGGQSGSARIIYSTPAWEKWTLHGPGADAREHLTDPEIDTALAEILPEVIENLRRGYPRGKYWDYQSREWISRFDDPVEPLLLGVCLHPGAVETNPFFEIWFLPKDDAETLDALDRTPSALSNKRIKEHYGRIRIGYTKKSRNGLALARNDDADRGSGTFAGPEYNDGRRTTTSTPSRPWRYFWSGHEQGSVALVEYPENQVIAEERAARINEHNSAASALQALPDKPLYIAHREATRRNEAEAYARFLDDYADPDLWEGHVKTLSHGYGSPFEPYWHPHGRGMEGPAAEVVTALRTLVDQATPEQRALGTGPDGIFAGLTVRDALVAAGFDVEALLAREEEADKRRTRANEKGMLASMLDLPLSGPEA